jgi:hypothetical protein
MATGAPASDANKTVSQVRPQTAPHSTRGDHLFVFGVGYVGLRFALAMRK